MTNAANARRRALGMAGLLAAQATLASPVCAADADPSTEQAQEAREQYQAGMQAYQAKRFVEAALHFEAAAAQKPHAVTLYTAALAWEQANHPDRAADDFVRALDVPGPGLSVAQTQSARERLTTLEKTMGTVEVLAPEGWRVQIDANTEVPTPAHLHALPGVHGLAGEGPGGAIQRRDVSLETGKMAHVELTPAPTPPPATVRPEPPREERLVATPPAPQPHGSAFDGRRMAGAAIAGVGIGALASGIVFGVSALRARDAYDEAPSRTGYDHANALATWTDVAFIAGGVLVAGGVALVIWPDAKGASGARGAAMALVPAPGGALVRGTF